MKPSSASVSGASEITTSGSVNCRLILPLKESCTSAPRGDFSGAEEVFATALSQEEAVTAAIHDLYRLADKLGDRASIPFLLDFISEQTEEEAMVSAIVDRLALADGQSGALFILDHELGAREGDPGV